MVPKEEIEIWRYSLCSAGVLNARSGRNVFEGVLIRVEGGHGCLHPWPELGDPPLGELLDLWRAGGTHRLVQRALTCAGEDRLARAEGRSLFAGLAVPESHATVVDWSRAAIERAVEQEFRTIKLKAGHQVVREAKLLGEWTRRWPALRWRLDFNGSLRFEEVRAFLQCLTDAVLEQIDFLEDPCPFDEQAWLALREVGRVPLAMDEGVAPERPEPDVLVLKPALVDPLAFVESAREAGQHLVITSNMEHPLGQCFAAVQAGRMMEGRAGNLIGCCGLQTHGLFGANDFAGQLGPPAPNFRVPAGTGLGFDALLEKLPWSRL